MQQAENAPVAQLEHATKRYGAMLALDDVSLEVRRGDVLALLGPNGAGKTTAISLLLGLLRPDSGAARIMGLPSGAMAARQRLGAMLQATSLPETLTVAELITLFRSYYPLPRPFTDVVALAGAGDLLSRRYAKLSGGQQRRAQFALAICGICEVLFLDEPTTGLDIDARSTMWQSIAKLKVDGCAIVLTTHYLEEAEALATQVAVLNKGRIVAQGSVQQIRARVAQRHIRCVSSLSIEAIKSWAHIRSVARDGDRIEIVSDAAEAVVRELLHHDANLADLEVRRAGLAEAFVEITREAA